MDPSHEYFWDLGVALDRNGFSLLIHVYVCAVSSYWPRVWIFVVLLVFLYISTYMQKKTNTYGIC